LTQQLGEAASTAALLGLDRTALHDRLDAVLDTLSESSKGPTP
jgi:hypothetical protein